MKNYKLTNFRKLSTEEQIHLNGGTSPASCSADCGTCDCTCKCTSQDPSKSVGNEFAKSGYNSKSQRKQAQAMQRM